MHVQCTHNDHRRLLPLILRQPMNPHLSFSGFKVEYELFALIFSSATVVCFWDHWSQSTQSKPALKLQSLCQTRRCIFNAVLAGGLIKYLCLSQSSNTVLTLAEWLSAPLSPLGKLPCVEWMLQTSAVTESHWWRSTIHQAPEDGEKRGPLNEHLKWWTHVADEHKSHNKCWPNVFFL